MLIIGNYRPIGNYQPISPLNSSLKILYKILANSLTIALGSIVGNYQFGVDMYILDGTATSKEVIKYCQHKKVGTFSSSEKAYDCLYWTCLIETLKHKGFGSCGIFGLRK